MRTGSEPTQARSALRLRLGLSMWGLLWGVCGTVLFVTLGQPGWAGVFGTIVLVALVDMGMVLRHIHQGAHYQPGRDIPPYWPVDRDKRR
jgi:hypothetical protein